MTPLERAARAVETEFCGEISGTMATAVARAVLAATREPSEAMQIAGSNAARPTFAEYWRAMIDAALAEEG